MGGVDPKDGMKIYAQLQEARQLAQVGEWDRCVQLLNEVLAVAPENVTARNVLALAAVRRGDLDEAERQYLTSLARQPHQHRVLGALGALALRRGDLDGAEKRFHEGLAMAPSYVEAMSNLGFVAAMRGDDAGAQQWYERAITVDPTYPHVHRRLADLFYDRKDWAHALDNYKKALALLPRFFEVLIQAGNTARFQGDVPTATAFYEDARRVRPDSWIPAYNLACLLGTNGDPAQALTLLGQAVDLGLAAPNLLTGNDDFTQVRALPGWSQVLAKAERAAARERSTN
jgi:Tfp pilus assembly protein PilF